MTTHTPVLEVIASKQDKLTKAHGTPVQFRGACLRAYEDGWVTLEEYRRNADEYEREWCEAGRLPDAVSEKTLPWDQVTTK